MRPSRFGHRSLGAVAATAALVAGGLSALPAGTAAAAPTSLPARYAKFAHCPVNNPELTYCLSASAQVTFTINSTTLSSNGPMTINLGLVEHRNGTFTAVLPDDGSQALSGKPITVPGGLTGVSGLPPLAPLEVTATSKLAGQPVFDIDNLELMSGPAFTLPLEVDLSNPLLTPPTATTSCSIGTPADPILLKVTDGLTPRLKGVKRIRGALTSLRADANGVLTSKVKLVDNTFAVPGASNCGLFSSLDSVVNAKEKLPSAAGTNAAVFTSVAGLAPAALIRGYLK